MTKTRFGFTSVLVGLAATVAIAAVPATAAADPTPVSSPSAPGRGTVALPPGGPVDTFPQDQTVGGADPFVPFGTDPFVPYGVWTP